MSISKRLFEAAERFAELPAISEMNGRTWNYARLTAEALRIAGWLQRHTKPGQPVVVRGEKSCEIYAAFVGAIYAGRPFVPLTPQMPAGRQEEIFKILGEHVVYPWPADDSVPLARPLDVGPEQLAYIMFTSGSTGVPKAIGISRANLEAFMQASDSLWRFSPQDRISQIYEIVFEPVVSDFMWAFTSGACLCPFRGLDLFAIASYLETQRVTVWGSSPSSLKFMLDHGLIGEKRIFPLVRFSAFIGERLPWELVERWRAHAPNSTIENHYGPTETTLSVTRHRLDSAEPSADRARGVPIGKPHPGVELRMVDESLELSANEGELVIAGPQVSAGYLNDPGKTAERFLRMPWDERGRIWYRSGDHVRRQEDGAYVFLQRADSQVKLRGHRTELMEIETRLIGALKHACVLGLFPWPDPMSSSGEGVVAVLSRRFQAQELMEARNQLFHSLMPAAVPEKIYYLDPRQIQPFLNASGKLDRRRLAQAILQGTLEQLWPESIA